MSTSSLLLEVGVPFRMAGGELLMETQAYDGVERWLKNFSRLTLCANLIPESRIDASMQWRSAAGLLHDGRFQAVLLPWAYTPGAHMANVGKVRGIFRAQIPQHTYLCFSGLGWLGAWGSVACEEARRLGRRYAIWLDWVLHEMPLPVSANPVRRGWHLLQRAALERRSFRDLRHAALGLFNGRTVYEAYRSLCNAVIAYDIHLDESDVIDEPRLEERLRRRSGPLRIVYAGRVHPMKGPWQWLEAMEHVSAERVHGREIHATWIGSGPLHDELRAAVRMRHLGEKISFPGAITEHARLMEVLREADLFVFCHLAPESPRCLIEALMSGLPIVGFESPYATDIVREQVQAGSFVPIGDAAALARAVLACAGNPLQLAAAARAARAAGRAFSGDAVFRVRAEAIRQALFEPTTAHVGRNGRAADG